MSSSSASPKRQSPLQEHLYTRLTHAAARTARREPIHSIAWQYSLAEAAAHGNSAQAYRLITLGADGRLMVWRWTKLDAPLCAFELTSQVRKPATKSITYLTLPTGTLALAATLFNKEPACFSATCALPKGSRTGQFIIHTTLQVGGGERGRIVFGGTCLALQRAGMGGGGGGLGGASNAAEGSGTAVVGTEGGRAFKCLLDVSDLAAKDFAKARRPMLHLFWCCVCITVLWSTERRLQVPAGR